MKYELLLILGEIFCVSISFYHYFYGSFCKWCYCYNDITQHACLRSEILSDKLERMNLQIQRWRVKHILTITAKIYTSILKLVMILSEWYYTTLHVLGYIWYYLLYSISVWVKVEGVNTSPLHFSYMSWLTIEFHIIRSYHHMQRRRMYFNNHLLRLVSIKSQQVWWHAPFIDSRINMGDNISEIMHYQPILNFNLIRSDVTLERDCNSR